MKYNFLVLSAFTGLLFSSFSFAAAPPRVDQILDPLGVTRHLMPSSISSDGSGALNSGPIGEIFATIGRGGEFSVGIQGAGNPQSGVPGQPSGDLVGGGTNARPWNYPSDALRPPAPGTPVVRAQPTTALPPTVTTPSQTPSNISQPGQLTSQLPRDRIRAEALPLLQEYLEVTDEDYTVSEITSDDQLRALRTAVVQAHERYEQHLRAFFEAGIEQGTLQEQEERRIQIAALEQEYSQLAGEGVPLVLKTGATHVQLQSIQNLLVRVRARPPQVQLPPATAETLVAPVAPTPTVTPPGTGVAQTFVAPPTPITQAPATVPVQTAPALTQERRVETVAEAPPEPLRVETPQQRRQRIYEATIRRLQPPPTPPPVQERPIVRQVEPPRIDVRQDGVQLTQTLERVDPPVQRDYLPEIIVTGAVGGIRAGAVRVLCFPGETSICMGDGPSRRIETIQVGDFVQSCDVIRGVCSCRRVERLFHNTADHLMILSFGERTLRATDNHPFYLPERREWIQADRLKIGDQLLTVSGETVRIDAIGGEFGSFPVFNFEVQGTHTYYAEDVLVHNCGAEETLDQGRRLLPPPQEPVPPPRTGTLDSATSGERTTDFVVNNSGEAVPIPEGAQGPTTPARGSGMVYRGGSGGHGMNERTDGVRIMDPSRTQGRRVNYMNESGQTVDPVTGRTIPNSDSRGHIPYDQ